MVILKALGRVVLVVAVDMITMIPRWVSDYKIKKASEKK